MTLTCHHLLDSAWDCAVIDVGSTDVIGDWDIEVRPSGSGEFVKRERVFVPRSGSSVQFGTSWLRATYPEGTRLDVRLVPYAHPAPENTEVELYAGMIEWLDVPIVEYEEAREGVHPTRVAPWRPEAQP